MRSKRGKSPLLPWRFGAMQLVTSLASIDEQYSNQVPCAVDVFDALLFGGFDVAYVGLPRMSRDRSVGTYPIIIRGQADTEPQQFMQQLLACFGEQASVPMIYTRDNDVYLGLQLVAC